MRHARTKQTSRKEKLYNGRVFPLKVCYSTLDTDGNERCKKAPSEKEQQPWEFKPEDMSWAAWNEQYPPTKPVKLSFEKWDKISDEMKAKKHRHPWK